MPPQHNSSGALAYVCDGTSVASPVLKDGASVYTPGLSERRGTTSKFLHSDALGTTRGVTDASQAATDSLLFDAFGQVVSRTGTTPTPFGFVGQSQYQTDKDSGLLLLGHRYYDPSIGRFLSQDPIHAGSNWYKYAANNPLGKVDPKGLDNQTLAGYLNDLADTLGDMCGGDEDIMGGVNNAINDLLNQYGGLKYGSVNEAAVGGLAWAGTMTEITGGEWGGTIVHSDDGSYGLGSLQRGDKDELIMEGLLNHGVVGDFHSHPPGSGWGFSLGDQFHVDQSPIWQPPGGIPSFVGGSNGGVLRLDPRPGFDHKPLPGNKHGRPNQPYKPDDVGNWKTGKLK